MLEQLGKILLPAYLIFIVTIIFLFIYNQGQRSIIKGIIAILSSSAIIFFLVSYISEEIARKNQEEYNAKKTYVDYVSSKFAVIDNYYIDHPIELYNLFYEFYGFNNFPPLEDKKQTKSKNLTPLEYIVLCKIIEDIYIMYYTYPEVFNDVAFRNKILMYTSSSKFRTVLSYMKNNYSSDFIEELDRLDIIKTKYIQVENIEIPVVDEKFFQN